MKFIVKITALSLLLLAGNASLQASNEKNPERVFEFDKDKYPLLIEIANNPVTYAQSSQLGVSHEMTLEYYKAVADYLANKAVWLLVNNMDDLAKQRIRFNVSVLKELEQLKKDSSSYAFTEDEMGKIDKIIQELKDGINRFEALLMMIELRESEQKASSEKKDK